MTSNAKSAIFELTALLEMPGDTRVNAINVLHALQARKRTPAVELTDGLDTKGTIGGRLRDRVKAQARISVAKK